MYIICTVLAGGIRPLVACLSKNGDFSAFAGHYGCAVYPARVRHPKDVLTRIERKNLDELRLLYAI